VKGYEVMRLWKLIILDGFAFSRCIVGKELKNE